MNEKPNSRHPFNILLVEDNPDDVLLTRHAFKRLPVAVDFQVASDGCEALKVLRRLPPYDDAPLPDIILLDLNMPRMDGRQLLSELKRDERLRIIPTIILTTSAAEEDVCNSYRAHASAYVTKPIDLENFVRRTRCLADFWLSDVALLPTSRR